MESLVQALGESATFGVFDRPGHARALTQVVADVEVRYTADINRSIPLYCTAIGRVLVAGQPEDAWSQLIGDGPFPAVTRHTVTDKTRVLDILGDVRRKGFCVVMEEFALGGTGVAAPVLDDRGQAVAALNVGCVTNRFEEKRDRVIAALKAAAGALSETVRAPAPLADAIA
jgi:DNA-binding IclR family transcriptional regulator